MQKYKIIDEFLDDLSEDKRSQVDVLRNLIISTEPNLVEHMKWNAPSYILDGEDRITFNIMNKQGTVNLVLHMGATRKENKKGAPIMQDGSRLIEWSSNIRGVVTFMSLEDVNSKLAALKNIITNWLLIPS